MAALRYVLIGDAESPHLLKWARALAPRVELHVASSRGFLPGFDGLVPPERRLALAVRSRHSGGNVQLLLALPQLVRWLRARRPQVVHAHYLTSLGTLAWLARRLGGVSGLLVGSAWGSDILVTPDRSLLWRLLTRRVLANCDLATSDSEVMRQRMVALGAAPEDVMVFPFGLEALPALPAAKQPHRFFANRGLEPIYAPGRVIACFAAIAADWPDARLVVANTGSLRPQLEQQVADLGLAGRVNFVGRLEADRQMLEYAAASWYLSMPASDSISVSVLEAMAHGCVPLLSDLPANRELVRSGDNGLLLGPGALPATTTLDALAARAAAIAEANHAWVREHALFAPAIDRFLERLGDAAAPRPATR